jgi:hypothetical protein
LVQFYQELPEAGAASRLVVALQKTLQAAQQHLPNAAAHLLNEDDALEGLSEFCARQQAQLLVLGTADGCLVRRFFNPHYRRTYAYHLRIPALLLPTSTLPTTACCASCGLRQAAAAQLIAQVSTVIF